MFSRLLHASRVATRLIFVATIAVACVATGTVMFTGTLAGAKAGSEAPEVNWQVTPEQKARIVALRRANFMHFFEACPLNKDDTPVVGPELDTHIQRHEDLDAHYPFTATQHERVLKLATQAGTPGFSAMLIRDAPVTRSTADMDDIHRSPRTDRGRNRTTVGGLQARSRLVVDLQTPRE